MGVTHVHVLIKNRFVIEGCMLIAFFSGVVRRYSQNSAWNGKCLCFVHKLNGQVLKLLFNVSRN